MSELAFLGAGSPVGLVRLAGDAHLPCDVDSTRMFEAAAAIGRAGPNDVTVFVDGDDPADLGASRAGACFVAERHAPLVPRHMIALVCETPLEALRRALTILYPGGVTPGLVFDRRGIAPAAIVHGDAILERDVTVEPGAVIGPRVQIGAGTTIGANAVIGAGVRVGRGCMLDAQVSIRAALIGDRVTVHAGARIGLASREGPGLGRVIVQDDVEIGANAVIERGRLDDTMIGERARIGALVVVSAGTLVDREEIRT